MSLLVLSSQPTVWPGEPVLMMLDDLEFQWKQGRLPNLLPAVELVMLAVLNADSSVKVWMSTNKQTNTCLFLRYVCIVVLLDLTKNT